MTIERVIPLVFYETIADFQNLFRYLGMEFGKDCVVELSDKEITIYGPIP